MVIPTIFTNKVFHSRGYKCGDEITRYTVNLQVTDQDTNQSIANVIQRKIGKAPVQNYFMVFVEFAEGFNFTTCQRVRIKMIYKDYDVWYSTGDYLAEDV